MKKLIYPMFAFAALAMTNTSCSDELDNGATTNSNEAVVSFNIQLENEVGSRALIGDGTKAKYLFFAVYKAEKNADGTFKNEVGAEIEALAQDAVAVKDDLTATINTRLVKGQSYNFVFWAQTEAELEGKYYNVTNLHDIKVIYTDVEDATTTELKKVKTAANNEERDAFFAVRKNLTVTGPIEETITLKRPFSQVNVGTIEGSIAEAAKAELDITASSMIIDNVATTLYPYSGQVADPVHVTFEMADIPHLNSEALKNVTINNETKNYEYLSMNYILVNDQNIDNVTNAADGSKSVNVNATLTIYGDDNSVDGVDVKEINTFKIPNITVQRNWRTNIIGDILSETVTFNIVIDPKFDNDHNYETAKELHYAFENGGEVTLDKNYTLDKALTLTGGKTVVLNLNGKNIITTKGTDAFVVNDGTLTIKGEGAITTEDKTAGYAIFADGQNAVVNIYGGTYTIGLDDVTVHGDNSCNSAVYTKNGAVANIYGGTFKVNTEQDIQALETGSKTRFLLNRNGATATAGGPITVYGGTFHEFNPANNVADGANTDFVAESYEAKKDDVENIWYVVKEGSTVATTTEGLNTALATANAQVALVNDVQTTERITVPAGASIDGQGNVLKLEKSTEQYAIVPKGGSIKNLNIESYNTRNSENKVTRAIYINQPTESVVIDNVTVTGVAYPLNTGTKASVTGLKLTVSNSTLVGWSSWDGGFASATFNNVHFGVGTYFDEATIAANPGWNGCIRPYVTTTLSNCTFDEGYFLMLDKLATGATITLKNCIVGNQVVNKDNILTLLGVEYNASKILF